MGCVGCGAHIVEILGNVEHGVEHVGGAGRSSAAFGLDERTVHFANLNDHLQIFAQLRVSRRRLLAPLSSRVRFFSAKRQRFNKMRIFASAIFVFSIEKIFATHLELIFEIGGRKHVAENSRRLIERGRGGRLDAEACRRRKTRRRAIGGGDDRRLLLGRSDGIVVEKICFAKFDVERIDVEAFLQMARGNLKLDVARRLDARATGR